MRQLMYGILVAAVAWTAAAERTQQLAYPTVAQDQSRPQESRPGSTTSHFENDPCSIDPTWCGYDGDPSAKNCSNFCQPESCGTKIGNARCLAGGKLGSPPSEYRCVSAAGLWCDRYVSPTTGKVTCSTCNSQ